MAMPMIEKRRVRFPSESICSADLSVASIPEVGFSLSGVACCFWSVMSLVL